MRTTLTTTLPQSTTNSLIDTVMTKQKRYITFYKLKYRYMIPYVREYGMMCTRSWWKCFKMGLRHIRKGRATFFVIEKVKPKETLHFP